MKPSQSFLKMTAKLLILLILFVCLFMISTILYSARYWPDVYNYINANITIKRIPTLSELDIQIIEVGGDFTTETYYSTTDIDYIDMSTIDDFDIDEFMRDELTVKTKAKRNIAVEEMKDFKDLPSRGIFVDYIFLEEPIELYNTNNTEEEPNILKTQVTSKVLEDKSNKRKENLIEYTKTANEYKMEDAKNQISAFMTHKGQEIITEIAHITTKEGYLVGDDHELKNDPPMNEPIELTTEVTENDEEQGPRLIEDLVDVSKLTTRSLDVELVTDRPNIVLQRMSDTVCQGDPSCQDFAHSVFPWVATIFIKNDSENSQFNYYCDGALVSEKVIITGGRCVFFLNEKVAPENVLVFLGKGNLNSMGEHEKLHSVKQVILHQNFSVDDKGLIVNDLAVLVLEDAATFSENIQAAYINYNGTTEVEATATTAWGPSGQLLPILFEKEKSEFCFDRDEDIFCTTYGNSVPLCPNYGGLYAVKSSSRWCLQGMFYGDPAERGLCFEKNVLFTSLNRYFYWIFQIIEANKV